ncbi:YfbK domain-containing protein [Roseibacillus persicicus]|uniref:YfbK domain-containing protein n=1 Tax=Roseibacillus persicicus TaxID=454148 RepID=UPI00281030BF|nr:von Willebrand factor type A domain-containing protein [Roseibacillus persicicus]MDQ8192544.1 von Willebrand factor type A domain-containing protein [Roseibacillus persicicus]
MKKEEIDDRLMDALLRGDCEEDLAEAARKQSAPQLRTWNWRRSFMAVAAMLVVGVTVGFLINQGQQTENPGALTTAEAMPSVSKEEMVQSAERELARLDAEIAEQREIVEEKRKVLDTIVRITGRPYFEGTVNEAKKDGVVSEGPVGGGYRSGGDVQEELKSASSPPADTSLAAVDRKTGVTVAGSVNRPGLVAGSGELTLAEAIDLGGGPSTFGTTKRVTIYREGKKYQLSPLTNSAHAQEKLYPGDVVEVDQVKAWEVSGDGFADVKRGAKLRPQLQDRFRSFAVEPKKNASSEKYGQLVDQPWKSPLQEALSTFSVDVDTASYTNLRRLIKDGSPVPADAVRIEELVNYFDYDYAQPAKGEAFGVGLAMATCPWEERHNLVRVALQGKDVNAGERGDANLVFLVDVSGSMQDSDKLPLLVESLGLLVEELQENDRVSLVVYAGSEGVVLEPTRMGQGGREKVFQALKKLSAGGSTNGGAGIKLAYRLAKENFVKGGVNRVILATDGDFNVGTTNRDELVELVKTQAKDGVFLSVCGFGRGNLNDAMLEAITNDGNGVYYYIDSRAEGRRVFLEKLMGTLVTIAKDVKIQVEFNPAKVAQYRLLGYANRVLKKEDFNNDKVDAGDIGSGHQVTAFYEIVPTGVTGTVRPEVDALKYQNEAPAIPQNDSPDWMTVKLRHKKPDGQLSELQEFPLRGEAKPWSEMESDYRFAAGVVAWGMTLRDALPDKGELAELLVRDSVGKDETRKELLEIVRAAK